MGDTTKSLSRGAVVSASSWLISRTTRGLYFRHIVERHGNSGSAYTLYEAGRTRAERIGVHVGVLVANVTFDNSFTLARKGWKGLSMFEKVYMVANGMVLAVVLGGGVSLFWKRR